MKKSLLTLFILAGCALLQPLAAQNSLIVRMTDATTSSVSLSQISRITFSSGNMQVKKTDLSQLVFAVANIQKMNFGTVSATPSVYSQSSAIQLYPNPAVSQIRFRNLSASESYRVVICSLDGKVLIQKLLSDTNEAIDVHGLSKGVYLVNMNGYVLKLIRE